MLRTLPEAKQNMVLWVTQRDGNTFYHGQASFLVEPHFHVKASRRMVGWVIIPGNIST